MAYSGRDPAKQAAVLCSGGIDSTCCIHLLKQQGFDVRGVFVDFGQAAAKQERSSIENLQDLLNIKIATIHASSHNRFGTGELLGRNAFLIMAAIFLAKIDYGLLAIGIHSGTPYYDCSPGFIFRMKQVAEEHTDGHLTVSAPLLSWDKAQIYQYFAQTGLPVDATYSCESGAVPPCGSCASCRDRRELKC